MSFDLEDGHKNLRWAFKRPFLTIFILLILMAFAAYMAWQTGFFSEIGRQNASSTQENDEKSLSDQKSLDSSQSSKEKAPNQQKPTYDIQTEGDQSPVQVVEPGGTGTINYGDSKNE